MINNHEGSPMS